jgi:hypothetical protein
MLGEQTSAAASRRSQPRKLAAELQRHDLLDHPQGTGERTRPSLRHGQWFAPDILRYLNDEPVSTPRVRHTEGASFRWHKAAVVGAAAVLLVLVLGPQQYPGVSFALDAPKGSRRPRARSQKQAATAEAINKFLTTSLRRVAIGTTRPRRDAPHARVLDAGTTRMDDAAKPGGSPAMSRS